MNNEAQMRSFETSCEVRSGVRKVLYIVYIIACKNHLLETLFVEVLMPSALEWLQHLICT